MSKTNNQDTTYTFTYSTKLRVEAVSKNGLELHHFGYDANGQRVSEQRSDGTLVFFVGEYYEYSLQGAEVHERKYYGREAMRVDGVLYFILTDHLGSTSVVTDENGNNPVNQGYDAWGGIRYTSGVLKTDKQYTGQRFSQDLSLYDYKARWYDPYLNRWVQLDPHKWTPQKDTFPSHRSGFQHHRSA